MSSQCRKSAAKQHYREGLEYIDETTREELSHVYQMPAAAVNNGVMLQLDSSSRWIVTGTSYLTRLELNPGAQITGPKGEAVSIFVDGKKVSVEPGLYTGAVTVTL